MTAKKYRVTLTVDIAEENIEEAIERTRQMTKVLEEIGSVQRTDIMRFPK
jgi:hypothetical protein